MRHPRQPTSRPREIASRLVALAGLLALLTTTAAATVRAQQTPAHVWIEGEDADRHTFNQHGWYSGTDVRRELLSPGSPADPPTDGDWLAHYVSSSGQTARAEYDLEITQPGRYTLWVRSSVYRVRQWYQLDDGPQIEMDLTADPRERLNLTHPALDIRFLAWIRAGELDLTAGAHRLTIGLDQHPALADRGELHGGIDVIALASDDWQPVGTIPPGSDGPTAAAPDAWFPLMTRDDPFDPASITDLSALIESPAGAHGPVRRVEDRLELADGTPIKLLGVNARPAATPQLMARQARFYAKHGINFVRLHPVQDVVGLLVRDPDTGARRLDPDRLDVLDRWFAALKAEGIYMGWSPFYPHIITPDDGYPPQLYAELPDRGPGKGTTGFVNVMPQLQAAEWQWLRALLEHENPYTGLRYADDPALAVVEVHNEDSIFWHYPLNVLAAGQEAPRHTAALQRMWMEWLQTQYDSTADLLAAWGPAGEGSRPGDALDNPSMPIYGAWEMEADGPAQRKAERRRVGDFIRFLAQTQRDYFARRGRQLRDVGFQGVTVTTAWWAGGPAATAANTWTDDALEMIDRHRYFGGGAGGHRITTGEVDNRSHLGMPGQGVLAVGRDQVEDKPFMVSEWSQSPPNPWKAEITPLMTLYGMGLQGWDALLHFSASSAPRLRGGWPGLNSYVSETPHYLGQFPALARAVHEGHISPGDIAAARRVPTDDLFRGVDPLTQSLPGLGWADAPDMALTTPAEALAMGRVSFLAEDDPPASERAQWDALWDQDAAVIDSTTGQLRWDVGRRVVTVRSPRTQAVIGFAGGGRFDLGAATVEVDTPFVSLLLTALDGRPLAESGHVLVTALARDRQLGARYSADQSELLAVGGPPLMLEPVRATITWHGAPLTSARPVGIYGVPREAQVERDGQTITIDGRDQSYYYELRTAAAAPTATPRPLPTMTATSQGPATATSAPTTPSPPAGTTTSTATPPPGATTPPVGTETVTPVGPTATPTPLVDDGGRLYLPALRDEG